MVEDLQVSEINVQYIAPLGQVGCGKSSFINAVVNAVFNDERLIRKSQVCLQGSHATSYHEFEFVSSGDSQTMKVRSFDYRGQHTDEGVTSDDIKNIVSGHVKSGYQVTDIPDKKLTDASIDAQIKELKSNLLSKLQPFYLQRQSTSSFCYVDLGILWDTNRDKENANNKKGLEAKKEEETENEVEMLKMKIKQLKEENDREEQKVNKMFAYILKSLLDKNSSGGNLRKRMTA